MLLAESRHGETAAEKTYPESPLDEEPRVGVLVCHCGSNIAGYLDMQALVDYLNTDKARAVIRSRLKE